MTGNHICGLALSAAILCSAAPAIADQSDGSWTMFAVTTSGHCGTIRVGLAIKDGHITSTSGKFVMRPIKVAGLIGVSGQTKMNAVAGPRRAQGTGRFTRSSGTGKWNGTGPSGICSGIWSAVRA